MTPTFASAWAAVPLLAVAGWASAQTPTGPATKDPLDARAAVPPLAWRSTLADYRRLRDEPPSAWRQANDAVRDIGGWRAYAREAAAPVPAASAPAAATARQP